MRDLRIESTWHTELKPGARFWLNHTAAAGQKTAYGECTAARSPTGALELTCDLEGISIPQADIAGRAKWLDVKHDESGQTCRFHAPVAQYGRIHPGKSILSLDVSGGGLGVSAGTEGVVRVWETKDGSLRRDLEGHKGDVYACRFFPSGKVVLTGGADRLLKIWDLESGECAADLKGHTYGVTSIAMVDRGRTLVSGSRDGTCVHWDVPTQAALGQLCASEKPLNAVDVGARPGGPEGAPPPRPAPGRGARRGGRRGAGGGGGGDDGVVRVLDLASREAVLTLDAGSAVNAVCLRPESATLAYGTDDGTVRVVDLRAAAAGAEVASARRSTAAVLCVRPAGPAALLVSTADGAAFVWDPATQAVAHDLTGPDFEAVYAAAVERAEGAAGAPGRPAERVFTGARDGVVRQYTL
eukprot:tig00021579_g22435.t1